MKKLMITALGLGLALGTVSFAQDAAPKMDDSKTTTTKKPKKAKKTKKPATDTSTTSTDKKM